MKRTIVQYRVQPHRVRENEAAVRRVYEELRRAAPRGLRYATFKLEDDVTFVHLVALESPDAPNPLLELDAFKSFTAHVRERCDELPVSRTLLEVAAYRF